MKPFSVKTKRIARILTRYPAHKGRVIATARRFLISGDASLAMKMPNGTANKVDIAVTASAIPRVRRDVERYAGTVKTLMKLSSVNPGLTREVKGLITQNAVISRRNNETIYTPTSQVMGSDNSARRRNLSLWKRKVEIGFECLAGGGA